MSAANEHDPARIANEIKLRMTAHRHLSDGDATGWFEEIYHNAGGDMSFIPWADNIVNPYLASWLEREQISGAGKRAIVIGCGLGEDAEGLAAYGFEVSAFDISETAVEWAKKRTPGSNVQYRVADLFHLPAQWKGAFDLVYECYTVQALPRELRRDAIGAVCDLVAPHGKLLVIMRKWRNEQDDNGPPWPLKNEDFALFANELHERSNEEFWEEDKKILRTRCLYERD